MSVATRHKEARKCRAAVGRSVARGNEPSVLLWGVMFGRTVPNSAVRIPGRATIPLGSNQLGKLFTLASPVSQLQETGVQNGVFGA